MPKQIRLNAFDMNCVAHQSPGLWTHPRDRADRYNTLDYWVELARLLERGKFDALFLADVLGVYNTPETPPRADIARHNPARVRIADVRRKEFEGAHRGALAGDRDERLESVCAANPDTIAHGRAL
jgi:hypothetical protein